MNVFVFLRNSRVDKSHNFIDNSHCLLGTELDFIKIYKDL